MDLIELELNEKELVEIYSSCNVTDEGLTEKRIKRYADKTLSAIFDLYIKKSFPFLLEEDIVFKNLEKDNIKTSKIKDTIDFIIFIFQHYYRCLHLQRKCESGELDQNECPEAFDTDADNFLRRFVRDYDIGPHDVFDGDYTPIMFFISNDFYRTPKAETEEEQDRTFLDIVCNEVENACVHYIKMKAKSNPNIDNETYFMTIPKTKEEAIFLLDDIVNGVLISMQRLFESQSAEIIKQHWEDEVNVARAKDETALKEENEQLKAHKTKLESECKSLQQTINSLKKRLERREEQKHIAMGEISAQNIFLKKQNEKLKKMIKEISASKQDVLEANGSDEKVEIPVLDIDLNLRYLFIGFGNKAFELNVLEQMPNAVFQDQNISITSSYDMVIVLTNHISHSSYYYVKEQCKNKGIPMIHSKYSNIELIKALIWNYMVE